MNNEIKLAIIGTGKPPNYMIVKDPSVPMKSIHCTKCGEEIGFVSDESPKLELDYICSACSAGQPTLISNIVLDACRRMTDEPFLMEALQVRLPFVNRYAKKVRIVSKEAGYKACGRNEPCVCGSGRKFKKCCIGKIKT